MSRSGRDDAAMAERGFTLIEMLVALTVAAILLGFAFPSFERLLAAERGAAAINQMVGAVTFARTEAILQRSVVTLCPGAGGICLGRHQWHQGAMAFIDHGGDGRFDGRDHLLRAFPPLRSGERIYWRSFRNRSYLQFHPRGFTQWQNGNFLYCPPSNDPAQARMAIVNMPGRVRMARDEDGDGVVENAGGANVTCP